MLFRGIVSASCCPCIRQISHSEAAELLKSAQAGEREPKNRWFLALLGLFFLGSGYDLAVTIESPLSAMAYFFLAVLLVVAGTTVFSQQEVFLC